MISYDQWLEQPYQDHYAECDRQEELYNAALEELLLEGIEWPEEEIEKDKLVEERMKIIEKRISDDFNEPDDEDYDWDRQVDYAYDPFK